MKTFKEYISEQPQIVNHSKQDFEEQRKDIVNLIKKNKTAAENIKDNQHYVSTLGYHIFYHQDKNGELGAYSVIGKNPHGNYEHQLVHKNGGKTEDVYRNLDNAIEKFGTIHSSGEQTPGGKQLWMNIHKHLPNRKLTYYNMNNAKEESHATPEFIKDNEHYIWGKDSFSGIRKLKVSK